MEDQEFNSSGNSLYYSATVGECLSHAWHQMWDNIGTLLAIIGIFILLSIPSITLQIQIQDIESLGSLPLVLGVTLASMAYSLFVMQPLNYGYYYCGLRAARGDYLEVANVFEAFKNYFNAILASLLVGIIVFVGILLLVVPGFIFLCKLSFVPFLVVDRKLSVFDAIRESWTMTEGHAFTVFALGIVSFFIILGGLLCFIVGVIIAGLWIQVAFGSLYHAVSSSQGHSTDIL